MQKILSALLVLCCLTGALPTASAQEEAGFLDARYTVSERKNAYVSFLSDEDVMTRMPVAASETLTMDWDKAAGGVYIQWHTLPDDFVVEQYDQSGALLSSAVYVTERFDHTLTLNAGCRRIMLSAAGGLAVSTLRPYSTGGLPQDVELFDEPVNDADLMLVVAYPGEEYTLLGGLIPAYTVEHEIETALVIAASQSRAQIAETLHALYALGVRAHPYFLGAVDNGQNTAKSLEAAWKPYEVQSQLEALLLRLTPRVLVSVNDTAQTVCARSVLHSMLTEAISASAYSLQKFYTVGTDTAGTEVLWTDPLFFQGSLTAQQVAAAVYGGFESQKLYRRTISAGTVFTLSESAVGPDTAGGDLFENIDTATLLAYVVPTPTPSPTAVPTPTPTAAPAASPAPTQAPEQPGFFAHIFAWLKSLFIRAPEATPTPVPTAVPTLVPAPTAAPTPTNSPAPSPSPAPDPAQEAWDAWFLPEGETEAAVMEDAENGLWSYTGEALSVVIERYVQAPPSTQLIYYVAHIRMRDYDSFRPAYGDLSRSGSGSSTFEDMAARGRAVLWITGDNLIRSDAALKGVIIRDGKIYSSSQGENTLAFYPDLTMGVLKKGTFTAEMLLASGVQNTYAFGPTLVLDGAVCKGLHEHRLGSRNPRCGIGMVEAGHFVAIMVEGRHIGSYGLSLPDFAQLFLDEGCSVAYNLDGGTSAGMVFMGTRISTRNIGRKTADGLFWGYMGD